ncbi:lipase 1-like [Contarinia nasturtii]|uniref:lipase 1-like n=1 Tax=Contarinia nasturtii TaxID=265458 RepID=UPI0012D3C799|nr:lipase 1-like [Contarinia nasturtii]
MFQVKVYRFILSFVILVLGRFAVADLLPIDGLLSDLHSVLQDPLSQKLCPLKTNELIEYYSYLAEEHNVITKDGYNLTIFRCNSKSKSTYEKEVVVLHHGIVSSSDDYCVADPSHALAYVLAGASYDVWLSNARGNFYSRRHITLNPDEKQFWNFTWYQTALYDYPAIFDYVIQETNQSKVYSVGHSHGTYWRNDFS